jgi:prevent-host-death family protein
VDDVGAYEAKTHLPRLLAEVEAGRTVTITKHGRPVARLVPATSRPAADDVAGALRAARRGVRLGRLDLRRLVEEGRR